MNGHRIVLALLLMSCAAAERDLPPPPPGMTVELDDDAPTCEWFHQWAVGCGDFALGDDRTDVRISCVEAMPHPSTAMDDDLITSWAYACAKIARYKGSCADGLVVCEALADVSW